MTAKRIVFAILAFVVTVFATRLLIVREADGSALSLRRDGARAGHARDLFLSICAGAAVVIALWLFLRYAFQ